MSSKHRKKDTSVKKEKKKVLPRLGDGYLAAIPLCSLGLDLALSGSAGVSAILQAFSPRDAHDRPLLERRTKGVTADVFDHGGAERALKTCLKDGFTLPDVNESGERESGMFAVGQPPGRDSPTMDVLALVEDKTTEREIRINLRLGAHNASTLHLFPPDTLLHTSHSVRFDVPATTDSGELLRTPKLSTYKPLALLFVQFIRFLNQSVKGASLSVIAASGNATLLQDALADKSLSFAYLEDVSMLLQLRYACVEPVKRVLAEHGPVPTEYSLQQAQQYLGFAEEWIEHALPCFHSDILVKAREFLQGIYSVPPSSLFNPWTRHFCKEHGIASESLTPAKQRELHHLQNWTLKNCARFGPSVQHDSYLHDDDPDDPPPRSTPPPVYQWQLYPSDSRPATPASSSSPASSNAGSRHDGHRTKDRSTSKKTARPTEPQPRTISLTEFVFGPKRPKKGKKKDHKQSRG